MSLIEDEPLFHRKKNNKKRLIKPSSSPKTAVDVLQWKRNCRLELWLNRICKNNVVDVDLTREWLKESFAGYLDKKCDKNELMKLSKFVEQQFVRRHLIE